MQRPNVKRLENQLVERAASGDADARRELFIRFRDDAYKVSFRITGRHEDAWDVVQDSFMKAFASLSGFQAEASFKTWLLRIVSNRALDVLRKRRIRLAVSLDGQHGDDENRSAGALSVAASDPPVDSRLERGELGERLQAALDRLPPDQKAVFAMYAAGETTYGQIAETLGIPIGTVMSRLYHARRRLRELLPDLAQKFDSSRNRESEE